jgi:hypothetical protein
VKTPDEPILELDIKDLVSEGPGAKASPAIQPIPLDSTLDQLEDINQEQGQEPGKGEKPGDDGRYVYKHRKKIDRRVHDAQEVLSQIVKAAKTITIYGFNRASVGRFVESAFGTLTAFLAKNRYMALMIEGGSIMYLGEEIYKEEAGQLSFAYKFYRDGIRKLVFLEGITPKELQDFSYLAAMCSQGVLAPNIDIVSSFWQESFTHMEYTVIDGLAPIFESTEGLDEKSLEQGVDNVFDMIASLLHSGRYDGLDEGLKKSTGGIRAVVGDIASQKLASFGTMGIGAIGELSSQAALVPPNYRDFIDKEIEAEDEDVLLQKLEMIILLLVRLGLDDREREDIVENVFLVVDMLLMRENLRGVSTIFRKLDEIASAGDTPVDFRERINLIRLKLLAGFGTDSRMEKIRLILCGKPLQETESLHVILDNIDEEAFRKLPGMVTRITVPENLKAVCKAFHKRRQGLDFVIQELMKSGSKDLVIEGLRASTLVEFEGKDTAIKAMLDSPDRNIRFEAIKAIASVTGEEGKQAIAKALEDKDREILITALEAVQRCEPFWAGKTLLRIITQEWFKDFPTEIQTKFFRTAARTNAPEVFAYFGELMTQKTGLFRKKEGRQNRLRVIDALRWEPSLYTYKIISGYSNDPRVPADIREYCKKTMSDIRKSMMGT